MKNFLTIIGTIVVIVVVVGVIGNLIDGDSSEQSSETTETVSSNEREEPEEPQMSEGEFKDCCEEYKYSDLLRYPEENKGQMVTFKAKVSQIFSEETGTYYRCYTDNSYSTGNIFLKNEMIIYDARSSDSTPIIKDDVLIVYGICGGTETLTRSLTGEEEEIPCVSMKYGEILEDINDALTDAFNGNN